MTDVITLTATNFDEEVLRSEVPVIVDYWAPWCGPCRLLGPVIEQIAAERAVPDDVVREIQVHIADQRRHVPPDTEDSLALARSTTELRAELISEQRRLLHQLLRDGKLSDESRRRIERELDLEEEALHHRTDLAL